MKEPWARTPTVAEHLASLRFAAMRAGFVVALLVAIGVEEGARAAAASIRRTLCSAA
jgi:hypothetical protein